MEGFEKKVLIIAGIILVVSLVLVLVFILMSKGNQKYPPIESDCPDYWELEPDPNDEKKHLCKNVQGLGEAWGSTSSIDVTIDPKEGDNEHNFQGVDGLCAKQKWSRQHKLTWEGVTEPTKDACIEDKIFQ